MRGKALLLTAVTGLVTAAGVARADEPAPPPQAQAALPARASVRRLIVDGDLVSARVLLDRILAGEIAGAERAAAAELSFVIDSWSASGPPKAAPEAAPPPMPPIEEDWQRAFSATREILLAGHHVEAAQRFERLVGSAPDLVAAARAAEMRSLAHDALPPAAQAPPLARATTPMPTPAEAPGAEGARQTRWYGWQTLILDGVAIVTTPFVPALGLGIYAFAPPLVHLGHGRGFIGLADVGLRVGAPIVLGLGGLVLGAAADSNNGGFNDGAAAGAAIGLVGGIIAAVAIDASVLAREKVAVESLESASSPRLVPLVVPRTAGGGGGVDLGLGGTF